MVSTRLDGVPPAGPRLATGLPELIIDMCQIEAITLSTAFLNYHTSKLMLLMDFSYMKTYNIMLRDTFSTFLREFMVIFVAE